MEYISTRGRETCVVTVYIIGTEFTQDYTLYILQVHFGDCQWLVRRRYREFYTLHEKLVSTRALAWELLPPKKFVGNLNPQHVEKRRKLLEKYIQNLLSFFIELPAELMEFLEVDRFDVNSVCNALTETLFNVGEELLLADNPIILSPLQMHCINRRLLLPLPTCVSGDVSKDIGHLYEFLHELHYLKVQGGGLDDTFVGEHDLNFDFSIFKSLQILEIESCCTDLISGFGTLLTSLKKLVISKSLQQLKDILISSDSWNEGVVTEVKSGCQEDGLLPSFPSWEEVETASFRNNDLTYIDNSVMLLRNVQELDLSHNFLTEIQHLEALICLIDLNLAYNEFTCVNSFPAKLGNIKRLNLATNLLTDTKGLEKMYSLEKLDISNNSIQDIAHIYALCSLPLLDDIRVKENPFCREADRRVRVFSQFGERYGEVAVDGEPPRKQEVGKIKELLHDMDSYEIISDFSTSHDDDDDESIDIQKHKKKAPPSPQKSPRHKRRDRIVPIAGPNSRDTKEDMFKKREKEEAEFREKMTNIQQMAGESWLSVLNNIRQTENEDEPQQNVGYDTVDVAENQPEAEVQDEVEDDAECETSDVSDTALDFLIDLLRDRKRLGLPSAIKDEVEELINSETDITQDTFLILRDDNFQLVEHLLSLDRQEELLTEIDMVTGESVNAFSLANVTDITMKYENGLYHVMFRCERVVKTKSRDDATEIVKFRMQGAKDALCFYATLKGTLTVDQTSCGGDDDVIQDCKTSGILAARLDNPLGARPELLLSFYHDFVRQASTNKKSGMKETRKKCGSQTSPTYENIDISRAFLKHDVPKTTTQDALLCLWVGCVPYLFPEEEIPVCLLLTNVNIFLFRVFLPESDSESPKSIQEVKECLHCFYSFALRDVKEVVVGLYDQGFRIEVMDEGARGTFTFLTRDATKTADFLEIFCKTLGIDDGNDTIEVERRKTFVLDQFELPTIVYPDEKKIKALKHQLAAQDLSPFHDRENLISYSIVYDKNQEIAGENQRLSNDTPMSFIRTLILTNLRLFLCEEDYVHWPLPSYVRSLPVTPEWVVDSVESVHSIIGVDIWEDQAKNTMTGKYGLTLIFEDTVCALTIQTGNNVYSKTWNVMFESLSEREQFTRSLSCLWKNQFDQTLTITYSKAIALKQDYPRRSGNAMESSGSANSSPNVEGHRRVHSGNVVVALNQSICTPDLLASLDDSRLSEYFKNFVSLENDKGQEIKHCLCAGCIPYSHKSVEATVALILSKNNIYIIVGEEDKRYIEAIVAVDDPTCPTKLWLKVIKVKDLQQIAVGLFDQKFRLEGGNDSETLTIVTRNFEKTNDFLQSLSHVLLAQTPVAEGSRDSSGQRGLKSSAKQDISAEQKQDPEESQDKCETQQSQDQTGLDECNQDTETKLRPEWMAKESGSLPDLCDEYASKLVDMYEKDGKQEGGVCFEFIHPNSHVKFVYPSDDTLDKLKDVILGYVQTECTFSQTEVFSVLLYALVFIKQKEAWASCTLVLSERFLCILTENHVDYPLPLFVKGLPDQPQYEVMDVRLLASIVCIEFQDLSSGDFSLIFGTAVEPLAYEDRFKTENVEEDLCLVTDVNNDDLQSSKFRLELRAPSFSEREKIFHLISKLWANLFSGRNLPVIRKKNASSQK